MNAIAFDTHAFVKKLKDAGFTETQAETLTELQQEAGLSFVDQTKRDYHLDELATRHDTREIELKIEATKRELDARIREIELKIELVRAELKKDIADTKADLTRWVVGMGILQSSLLIGALMRMNHLL